MPPVPAPAVASSSTAGRACRTSSSPAAIHPVRTLCTARRSLHAELEAVWEGLFAVAATRGLRRLGQLVLDSSRWRADAGREATVALAAACLQRATARHRTVRVGQYHAELEAARQRFGAPEQQARYRYRGEALETVFACVEQVPGYRRWSLRGTAGVAAEAGWIGLAYQVRKVYGSWAAA